MTAPRILVISAMRDEGPHLLEWIAHHRALGVSDFLIFSNGCDDGTDVLLDHLHAAGIVTHVRNEVAPGKTPQWSALKTAARHPLTQAADWIAVLDCDEFVHLKPPLSGLPDLIAAVGEADAIALRWRLFGHDGHARRPQAPTLRAYTRAIVPDALYPALSGFFKTLYRVAGPFQKPGVHRPRQKPQARPRFVDGSGRALPDDFVADPGRILLWDEGQGADLAALNHYSVRSAEDFLIKARRGLPNRTAKPIDLTYWVERNFNMVEETGIQRHWPATGAELARLRALPGVAVAETSSRAWQAACFDDLLRDPAMAKLYGRLLLAAGSTAPGAEAARALVALYRRAAGTG
ncbi:glycosyltransferase family 2 protein [Mesobaculum littorinae]|uniref:Glycosyltransferase family 2 protein n=1 Tax=Mesobaculum littorinae TaxID=2486419 RepID=A0A438AJN9_9RHOB|nr:glycosyltransferase family 2 protein [Mesobaculum littorinae]RVV98856.1 glycosyltransferase family 2 protein [Mesobaculum littorinae]